MVRASALVLLAACAARPPTSTVFVMTAAKKASAPAPRFFQECDTLPSATEGKAPTWESLVLATDVQTSASGACEALERSLTPLAEAPSLSRQALRDECDEKSEALVPQLRASCRAVCGARRWLDGRAFARERLRQTLEWARDDFDFFFDRIERCPATKAHGNQLPDAQVRAVFACGGRAAPPAEVTLLFQYVTEPVSWQEHGGTVSSARPVEAQWLQASDPDPNLPWRAMVTRCREGAALRRVLVRF